MKKKLGFAILAVMVFLSGTHAGFAADDQQKSADMMAPGSDPHAGMGMGDMMMPHMGMMGMGGKDSMVATSDGGVVVMSGRKLIKYDKDLNVVKEVEIKKSKPPMIAPEKAIQPVQPAAQNG